MFMTSIVTFAYFFSLIYVVYKTTIYQSNNYAVLLILENLIDVIASLSNNTFSFLFALMMNFFLLFGIFCLNICSIYLADLARSIE